MHMVLKWKFLLTSYYYLSTASYVELAQPTFLTHTLLMETLWATQAEPASGI